MMDLMCVNFFLLLLTCAGLSFAQQLVLPATLNGKVGDNVTFNQTQIPPPPNTVFSWSVNGTNLFTGVTGGSPIIPEDYKNRVNVDMSTLSLELRNLTKKDTGTYTLTIISPNTLSASTSLQVFVGPEKLQIIGPNDLEEGNPVILNCTAESTPDPSYQWDLNGTRTDFTTAVYTVHNASFKDSGNYTCTASNSITKRNATAFHILKVKGIILGEAGSLSTGAIVGIIIGVLVVIAVTTGLIFYFLKPKILKKIANGNKNNGASDTYETPDLHYQNMSWRGMKKEQVKNQTNQDLHYQNMNWSYVKRDTAINQNNADSTYESVLS